MRPLEGGRHQSMRRARGEGWHFMAPGGHISWQHMHETQRRRSISGRPWRREIAPTGHTWAQMPQEVHRAVSRAGRRAVIWYSKLFRAEGTQSIRVVAF